MVWSKELISFTKIGDDAVLDAIQLLEVVSIQLINDQPKPEGAKIPMKSRLQRSGEY